MLNILLLVQRLLGAEKLVHALQAKPLSLRHEEPRKDGHGEAEAAEEHVCPIPADAQRLEHRRHRAADDEVEQPLHRGAVGDVGGAQPSRRDLGHVDPGDGAPAELVHAREYEDAREGDVAGRGHGGPLARVDDADEDADVEHGQALADALFNFVLIVGGVLLLYCV